MPELPEVETIRRQIEKHLLHEKVQSIELLWHPVLFGARKERLYGGELIEVRRFGKLLVLDFSSKYSLCVHLKMTGRLSVFDSEKSLLPHTRMYCVLESGKVVAFSDSRKFGYVHLLPSREVSSLQLLQNLGKEPLKELTLEEFSRLLAKTSRPIKTVLLDQTKIAGIGNIYACESLWMAKIDPKRKSNSLTQTEIQHSFQAIEEVLQEGLDRGGASDNTYRDLLGNKGNYQNFFKVYGLAGKPCQLCGTTIERYVLGGRGTFWCPQCQQHVTRSSKSLKIKVKLLAKET